MSSAPGKAKVKITPKNGSKMSSEELKKHLLQGHLSIMIEDDTLSISLSGCGDDACPVPDNVSFFYCRQPPCPK